MLERIIIAGAGGQGNLFFGKTLCLAAIEENKNVTWLPSYGPAMRGGESTCTVIISDEEIGSPIVKNPDTLIVMNKPSLSFMKGMNNGLVIINQSLADYEGGINNSDLDIMLIETEPILREIDSQNGHKILNVLLLGVYLKRKNTVDIKSVKKVLSKEKEEFFEMNIKALMAGYEYFN
jgi:2-oxoglutarate ferredoxin oxidoreductase subunit gamma